MNIKQHLFGFSTRDARLPEHLASSALVFYAGRVLHEY
jgi:hypothetical protein